MMEGVPILEELDASLDGTLTFISMCHWVQPLTIRADVGDLDGEELLVDDALCLLLHLLAKLSRCLVDLGICMRQ